ncbi:hypothetical protein [Pseudarthrobacter cellobiosi]|uniref:hypothetical protein n=1 Tax=Pseudarthrobacter cellobiosi TaxID=2953654 RepID=UPI00208E054D|nr:hypothetical protein [Pseudarthrobacter sp. HLT1-5]MCO4254509.1 hypothetical protein [Pseudarthrobacter sp. HLT1-5]
MPDKATNDGPLPGGDQGRTAGMPLGARRLVLIGGLCIPVGLVAGPYLFGIQLIAVAGVVAISVALSYGIGRAWFTRWPRLTAAAGGAWMAATIGYWLTIMAAADASAPVPEVSSVLFSTGVAAVIMMAAAVLAGTIARFRSRRLPAGAAA